MIAKIHLRRQLDGGYYVQGYIPPTAVNAMDFPEYTDCIAAADIELVEVKDREKQYDGKSNELIRNEGFK
jgi:hypothetical protein